MYRERTLFQSTHPAKGCDMAGIPPSITTSYFNPRTLRKGATPACVLMICLASSFQSTHPAKGCDWDNTTTVSIPLSFQSTHPAKGCDLEATTRRRSRSDFNPRASYEARHSRLRCPRTSVYISIHALHMKRDAVLVVLGDVPCISIHALHMKRDCGGTEACPVGRAISIHALHMKRDRARAFPHIAPAAFQSTRFI